MAKCMLEYVTMPSCGKKLYIVNKLKTNNICTISKISY